MTEQASQSVLQYLIICKRLNVMCPIIERMRRNYIYAQMYTRIDYFTFAQALSTYFKSSMQLQIGYIRRYVLPCV